VVSLRPPFNLQSFNPRSLKRFEEVYSDTAIYFLNNSESKSSKLKAPVKMEK
jgi:hypothetical protein